VSRLSGVIEDFLSFRAPFDRLFRVQAEGGDAGGKEPAARDEMVGSLHGLLYRREVEGSFSRSRRINRVTPDFYQTIARRHGGEPL